MIITIPFETGMIEEFHFKKSAPFLIIFSLRSSLFRFLLAGESESQGEVATNFFVTSVPEPSRDSRLPERKRKRLLRRLDNFERFKPLFALTSRWP